MKLLFASPLSTRKEVELFRLAKIDGVLNQIDSIYELYPWRVGDVEEPATSEIGDPIFTLTNELKRNEIWLEGQELEIAKYKKLFKVYGYTYGTPSDDKHFVVPNFIDRSIWGISHTSDFSYISGALPNISATSNWIEHHAHNRGTMEISGTWAYHVVNEDFSGIGTWGAFSARNDGNIPGWGFQGDGECRGIVQFFTASNGWSGETSYNGGHSHTITLNKSSLYQDVEMIKPTSLGIKVKTRYC